MTKTLEAIYDGEDLKLTEPLNLPPNTKVKITIEVLSDIDVNEKRKALFDALEKTQSIWANRSDIDKVYRELEENWEKWNNELKSLSTRPS